MDESFESLCRFCFCHSSPEKSITSLKDDKILVRLNNKLVNLKNVLKSLDLESSVEKELPSQICDDCKKTVLNFYELQKTFRENEAVLLGKSSQKLGTYNEEKEKLLRAVEEFYGEFEDGDELNIIKYRNKLVIEKSFSAEIEAKSHSNEGDEIEAIEEEHLSLEQNVEEEFIVEDNTDNTETEVFLDETKQEAETNIQQAWKCHKCDFISSDQLDLENHLTNHIQTSDQIKGAAERNVRKRKLTREEEEDDQNLTNPKTEDFSCNNCQMKFSDERAVNEHTRKYSPPNTCNACKCEDCGILFQSEIAYQKHSGYHFLSKMSALFLYHECLACKVVYGNSKDLDHHNVYHAENKEFTYTFEGKSQIEGCDIVGRDTPDSGELWICGHCNMKFGSINEANFHLTLFHANAYCPFCKQSFGKSVAYLVNHLKLRHPDKFEEIIFNCSFCNESFSAYHDMKEHEKHCNNKKFSCDHCDKKFALERQLKEHLSCVKGEFRYSCGECKKFFSNKSSLTVHKRIHTKERPYFCAFPGCEKSFRTNSQVSAHMDTHSEYKNFKCKYCDTLFQTRGARRVHEKTHYMENICKLCAHVFKQRSHLIRHVNSIHKIKCDSKSMDEQVDLSMKSL